MTNHPHTPTRCVMSIQRVITATSVVMLVMLVMLVALIGSMPSAPNRLMADDAAASGHLPTPRALVKAVNALAPTDIPIAPAQHTSCTLTRLPGSLSKLLPLLPGDHRSLIAECAKGRIRLARNTSGFDFVAAIEAPERRPAAEAAVRAFFDERVLDVACGDGVSADPYPIRFDWIVVLDVHTNSLYSFILNCQD